jgi:two-component system, cell cycle sensor histidine kinase and response regulator CckA
MSKPKKNQESQDRKIKQTEQHLLQNDEWYKSLFHENHSVMMLINPATGGIIDANQAACHYYGWTHSEMCGRNISEINTLPTEKVNEEMQNAMNEGRKQFFFKHRLANGEIRDVEVFSGPIKFDNVTLLYSLVHDITDRKKAEEALRESEEKHRDLYNTALVGLFRTRISDGKILMANPAGAKIMGYDDPEKLIRADIAVSQFYSVDQRAQFIQELREKGKVSDFEANWTLPGGRELDIAVSAKIFPEAGYLEGVIVDITERKKAEAALVKSEERFRKFVEQAPVAMAIVGINGKVEFINHKATSVFGYTIEDIPTLDNWWGQAFPTRGTPEELAADWKRRIQKAMTQGQEIKGGEYQVTCKDGTVRTVITSGVPVFDKIFVIFNDITEFKNAEADRLRLEQQIQQNQKLESLGVLAGGIAHDFNNLMGGIFGYIDLSIRASKDGKVTSYLSTAANAIDRARGLTAQLLTFAKGGAPVKEITSIAPIIKEATQFALSGSSTSCSFEIAGNLWLCNIDKNQIGQIIDNIVINAHQSMPNGGAISATAVNISLKDKEHLTLPAGDYVKISIKDSGIGIPKEILPRIFDPFFTTKAKGRGLGLATCYSIIKRHSGAIDVESETGKGSTFHIYLPASKDSVLSSKEGPPVNYKGSGTILLMDDEEIIREAIGEMLNSIGFSVVCKENGREAIDFFTAETRANRKFAGMIFDLTIQGGMGWKDVVKEIRKLNSDIPVFVASGYADDPVMKAPAEYGFTASICKPFTIIELTAMLEKCLKTTI